MVDEYRIALGLLFIGFGIVFAQNLWIYFTACDFQANTNHRLNENSRLIKFLVDRNAEDRKLIGELQNRVEELEALMPSRTEIMLGDMGELYTAMMSTEETVKCMAGSAIGNIQTTDEY
mgnify:CR=1 FL=1